MNFQNPKDETSQNNICLIITVVYHPYWCKV